MSKEDLVPKLRFPEFRDDTKWEKISLGEIGDTIAGLSGKSGSDFGSGKPYITYMQVFKSAWIDLNDCGKVLVSENEKQNIIQKGDILITTSSETPDEVGYASVMLDRPSEPIYLNSFCFVFRPKDLKLLNPRFSSFLFRSPTYRKSISILAQGSTRFNISKGAFLKLEIPITENELEQQKIADCLSSLDELIAAHTEKLTALKAHKKGLMQQLFPAEGETVPKLRFKEFEGSGDWEEKTLEDIFIFKQGVQCAIEEQSEIKTDGWVRFIRIVDLTKNDEPIRYIKNPGKGHLIGENDLFMVRYGNPGMIGYGYTGVIANNLFRLVPKSNIKIDNKFYYFILHSIKTSIVALTSSSTMPALNFTTLNKLSVSYTGFAEQQKIADSFSSLDNLITTQTEKIATLKSHKKGLMQGLFPVVNNITE